MFYSGGNLGVREMGQSPFSNFRPSSFFFLILYWFMAKVGFAMFAWGSLRPAGTLEDEALYQAIDHYRGYMPTAYWEPSPDAYPRISPR